MLNMVLANAIIVLTLFFLVTWFFIALVFYFIPVITAYITKHPHKFAIILLNIFLGWTLLGWLIAFIWAMNLDKEDNN